MVGWRDLEATVDKTIAVGFGEAVYLYFVKGAGADPERPATTARAVLHTGGDDAKSITGGHGGDYRMRLSAGQAELFLDHGTYAGPMPRKGDRVRADDRAGRPWWKVEDVSDRYSNLVVLTLSQL